MQGKDCETEKSEEIVIISPFAVATIYHMLSKIFVKFIQSMHRTVSS